MYSVLSVITGGGIMKELQILDNPEYNYKA
jgi:hypothetical protein